MDENIRKGERNKRVRVAWILFGGTIGGSAGLWVSDLQNLALREASPLTLGMMLIGLAVMKIILELLVDRR